MITVYQYGPAWGLPCISPFVTKLSFYLDLTSIPHILCPQDLTRLDEDAPHGKLPYVVFEDGRTMADSTEIIATLEDEKRGQLDQGLSRLERADMLAWTRLCDENLYWSGVVSPRWSIDENFQYYASILTNGTPPSPAQADALRLFRTRVLAGLDGHGMGRRTMDSRLRAFIADIDAIADRLEATDFLMGPTLRSGDAGLYAMLAHIMDAPFAWSGRDYARSRLVLVRYCRKMRAALDARRRATG